MNNAWAITAEHLTGGYGPEPVWRDASFQIKKGEFITVLGPNGSGKTTLFRLLLGLLHPTAGTLSVLGKSPNRGDARIGYVPQRHDIDRDIALEAREFVKLGSFGSGWGIGSATGISRASHAADEALRLVRAEDLAHTSLGGMSGGELQRIFLAQALMSEPDILLLDEPLANLDIRRESDLVSIITDIVRSRGVTVLLISHNINPLLRVTDRVLYVANGTVMLGTPAEVLTSDTLSKLYGIDIEVLRDSSSRLAIIGMTEEGHGHGHA